MRRVWLGQLVLLAALDILTGPARSARAADLPYAGTWKIVFFEFDNAVEIDVWLVKIDNSGNKAELLSTVPDPLLQDNKVVDFKASAGSLQIHLRGTHSEFEVYAHPAKGKADSMLGCVRMGSNFNPIRMEKTEAQTINPKMAKRPMVGLKDLEATVKTRNADERIKILKDLLDTYAGKPITLITSQVLLRELFNKKSAANAFQPVADGYVKLAAPYGRQMQIHVNVYLARNMLNYDPTVALALKYAEQGAKLLADDDNRAVRLMALMTLANAQYKNTKNDGVKTTLAKMTALCDEVIKKPRMTVGPLLPTREMAVILLQSLAPVVRESGLEYARRAVKLIKDETSTDQKVATYRLLRGALVATGKEEESKKVAAVVEKLDVELDRDYLKVPLPFKPGKYAGRKAKSDRVAVVELFTNAQSSDCPAADIAFDGLEKTYSPRDVALLEYHQHARDIPPDPLVNLDTEARAKFYEFDMEDKPPTVFVNGKPTMKPPRGDKQNARAGYDALRKAVDESLETPAGATIKLQVTRTGDKIDIAGDLSDLKESGPKARLRFVLVEDTVRYVGLNGVRMHHHVVRALPGGAAGFALDKKATSHKATINVSELRKNLLLYYTAVASKAPFPNPEIQLKLGNLKIIALIQDDDSKKIFQSVEADVPEAKEDNAKDAKKE